MMDKKALIFNIFGIPWTLYYRKNQIQMSIGMILAIIKDLLAIKHTTEDA